MDVRDLKNRKKALKLTTAELAFLADLPVSTVSKIMTGETRKPSYITIEKLDAALVGEERLQRLKTYLQALRAYLAEQSDKAADQKKFFRDYRKSMRSGNAEDTDPLSEESLALSGESRMTVGQLDELGEDRSLELLDGCLIWNEAPGVQHQRLVQQLGEQIGRYIREKGGPCEVFYTGVNVRPDEDEYTLLIPDIAVLCDPGRLEASGIIGAPDWVIEVTSDSTRRRDYGDKMHKYMAAGTYEYWIVDPEKEKVTVYTSGEPMLVHIYGFEDEIPVEIYRGELRIRIVGGSQLSESKV